ncbi:hypothetical protein [Bradyrhizobium sp. CCGE-LA001]|uniref:hypothetical protein n=1 Tax=Bradyrhizobium sp. CCGE-LA001 TaxID=1223566 RepID=UPI0011982849|nr:hypothetical protein [Bradyrhizobium sp. CCGE-LA001]
MSLRYVNRPATGLRGFGSISAIATESFILIEAAARARAESSLLSDCSHGFVSASAVARLRTEGLQRQQQKLAEKDAGSLEAYGRCQQREHVADE